MNSENSFINAFDNAYNMKKTENGGDAYKSTNSAVYDMFAFGGAYRNRSFQDCILLFMNALQEDEELAMKCLFYLRDCIEGQGERRFFRICFRWLCNIHPEIAKRNMKAIAAQGFGRFDDIIYSAIGTNCEEDMVTIIREQLKEDMDTLTPSLLGKWMPSENASKKTTKETANKLRKKLQLSHKSYRKMLSHLREKINIVERLISANKWEDIDFSKLPSKAGLKYKNAFLRREEIAQKYQDFIKSDKTTVNVKTLYPYDVVREVTKKFREWGSRANISESERAAIEKYWNSLPDYLNGKPCKIMCVCDTSGSMTWSSNSVAPIDVAISLSMYCAERIGGPYKNHYISFSSRPTLIKIEGIDFCDKVERIYRTNLCEDTNLEEVFNLIKAMATDPVVKITPEDLPETLIIISDMEINEATPYYQEWTVDNVNTMMEKIRLDWEKEGLKLPKLVYWNVEARNNTILDAGPNVSFVSGCSPVILENILSGKTGHELMLQKLNSDRYKNIR
mgnify:FL=1